MAIGARIRQGDGSLVQIDPGFECLCMKVGPVTVSVPASTTPGDPVGKTTISVSGCNEPILALSCGTAFVGVLSKIQSGTTFSWEIVTSVVGANVTYWVFDTTDVSAMQFPITKGLRMRNPSNGRIIFDSRYKYMRIWQTVKQSAGTIVTNIPISPPGAYAIGVSTTGLYTRVDGGPVGGGPSWMVNTAGFVVGFRTNNDGTLSITLIRLALSITSGPSPPYPPTGIMGDDTLYGLVLDMRNY